MFTFCDVLHEAKQLTQLTHTITFTGEKNIVHCTGHCYVEIPKKSRFHCMTISIEEFVFIQFVCFPHWGSRYGPPVRTQYRVIVDNMSSRTSWQVIEMLQFIGI